jgi:hypothetical protein
MTISFFQTCFKANISRRFCGVLAGPTLVVCTFASPAPAQSASPQQVAAYTEQKVTASDGTTNSYFGSAAALDGPLALIGADGENSFEGAAYIFSNVSGVWTEGQKLTPSDGLAGDEFGYRAALRDDTAVVTAFSATVNGTVAQGAAYVFTQSAGVWSESQKLLASDGGLFDNFGASVAISGDVIAIGANGATVGQNPAQGAVYVFTQSDSNWIEAQKLVADDGAAFDNFGISVAHDGQTILAGAPSAAIDGKFGQGAVYRFARINGVWTQVQKLVADDGASGDSFGQSLAMNQRSALIGAYNANINGTPGAGAVYVFDRSGGLLVQTQKLSADAPSSFANFGNAVALSGHRALIAADVSTVAEHTSAGEVYLFRSNGGSWSQTQTFTASDGMTDDFFGAAIALEPGTALIATPHPTINGNTWQGAAYFDSNPAAP